MHVCVYNKCVSHTYIKYLVVISIKIPIFVSRKLVHALAWRRTQSRTKCLNVDISAWSRRPSKPFWHAILHRRLAIRNVLAVAFFQLKRRITWHRRRRQTQLQWPSGKCRRRQEEEAHVEHNLDNEYKIAQTLGVTHFEKYFEMGVL